ncbi:MAG TPA: hypothetical protein VFW73_02675 [Lacipirellulaceae bacterium]|nr:hypothetical protein [Lacipirellulaceae bacterium]
MRLTLRTLLAYLDDVLDPADKEELAHKIESSDFAEDLVHRTRDTVRRLRLSAPQVIGNGIGLDPNSVAEYLDNVMAPDAVGDFERICLESDVHLAEAAACHHVLTMVLGQPAEIDPLARQRMYTIASEAGGRKQLRVEPAHVTTSQIAAAGVSAEPIIVSTATEPQSHKAEIPEYLRAGGWWRAWGAWATVAVILVIGAAVLLTTDFRNRPTDESSMAKVSPQAVAPAADNESAPTAVNQAPSISSSAQQATPSTQIESVVPTDTQVGPASPVTPPAQPSPSAVTSSPPAQPATTPEKTDRYAVSTATNNVSTTPPQPAAPAESTTTAISPPATQESVGPPPNAVTAPGSATANVPVTKPSPEAFVKPSMPPQPRPSVIPPASTANGTTNTATVAASEATFNPNAADNSVKRGSKVQLPPGPIELGTYMGGKTVLLRYDSKAGSWFRVEPRAAVTVGERLLALPEFRPKIAFVSGLNMDVSGGTEVVMSGGSKPMSAAPAAPIAAAEIPEVELVYGRIVFVNSAAGDSRVRLKLGSNTGEAQITRNSTLAVEVEREYVPGQDPRKAAALIDCRLYAPDGGVVWKDAAGSKSVEKASRWTVNDKGATQPVADPSPPDWIYREPIGLVSEQRYGAPKIESTLVSNVPAETQLLELFQSSKQPEVKSLVTRSCINVGQFVPFVEALRDSEQKWNWKAHINALRSAMALSPDSANKVWQTLVDQRGRPAAADLYEMLCGYSADEVGHTPEQMKTGAVAKLINWLENDSLDYRVLAWNDLREITGKQLLSNPADTITYRTRGVRAWRERLKKGDLKPVLQAQ